MATENEVIKPETLEDTLKSCISECFEILDEFSDITEVTMLDFFIENHFEKIPASWQQFFISLSLPQLGTFIDLEANLGNDFMHAPPNLLAIRSIIGCLCIPRNTTRIYRNILPFDRCPDESIIYQIEKAHNDLPLYKEIANPNSQLMRSLFKRVKRKKRHEICVMADMTHKVNVQVPVDLVVDVGAGQGHLSRLLCFGYGLNMMCIEAQESFNRKANELDINFEKLLRSQQPQLELPNVPKHLTHRLSSTVSSLGFMHLLRHTLHKSCKKFSFGIIGLHPCGDLATTLLRVYKENDFCKYILLSSCCYMKLTNGKNVQSNRADMAIGFPVSKFLKTGNFTLSTISCELACHAIEKYIDRLKINNLDDFYIHAYRACIEKLLSEQNIRHQKLSNVSYRDGLTFQEYCEKALKGTNIIIEPSKILSTEVQAMLLEWKKVVIFYCLRLMLAPLIESVILNDRYLYLIEDHDPNIYCDIKAFFDPRISPRNHMLVAHKQCIWNDSVPQI